MRRTVVHDLETEVRSISGWYRLHKEGRIAHKGKEYLYLVGIGVVESSCCGTGGCQYAVVPGAIVSWKCGKNDEGFYTSEVELLRDEELKEELKKILLAQEAVSQVQFW